MTVQMMGHTQTTFRRFLEASRGIYSMAKQALLERFEPPTKKDVYVAEFQCRKKDRAKGWGDFADALKTLVEKAFPNLGAAAKETLALNQYLTQLENPQIAFGVKQQRPSSLVEAVSFTIEMESYLQKAVKLAPVMTKEPSVVSTIQSQQGELVKTLEDIAQWLKNWKCQCKTCL